MRDEEPSDANKEKIVNQNTIDGNLNSVIVGRNRKIGLRVMRQHKMSRNFADGGKYLVKSVNYIANVLHFRPLASRILFVTV